MPIWMMRPGAFESMATTFRQIAAEPPKEINRGLLWASGDAYNVAARAAAAGKKRAEKYTAVMGLYGMIDKRSNWMLDFMGGTSTDAFGAVFDQLVADPNVRGIVIDVDSPGGSAVGTYELSRKIYDARASKPIVTVVNAEMCSAAYYIGSAASRVFATPSASTGSIGVWSAAAEYSKQLEEDGVKVHVWRSEGSPMKAAFLPWEEFSKEAIKDEQKEVDRIYDEFLESVARNRGITAAVAQKNFGEGRVMSSKAAISAGLVDRIATLEDVVGRMNSGKLTLASLGQTDALEAAFSGPCDCDAWKDENEAARMKSRLKRKGALKTAGDAEPEQDALFVYGTLKRPDALAELLNRDVELLDGTLDAYGRVCGDLKGREDEGPFCDLLPDDRKSVDGKYAWLTDDELVKCDNWESRYERRDVTLANGVEAQAYFLKDDAKDDLKT